MNYVVTSLSFFVLCADSLFKNMSGLLPIIRNVLVGQIFAWTAPKPQDFDLLGELEDCTCSLFALGPFRFRLMVVVVARVQLLTLTVLQHVAVPKHNVDEELLES